MQAKCARNGSQLPMLSRKARPITLLTGNGDTAASHCRGCTPHRTTGLATHFACPRLNPTLLAAPHQHSSWLRARMFILVNHDRSCISAELTCLPTRVKDYPQSNMQHGFLDWTSMT